MNVGELIAEMCIKAGFFSAVAYIPLQIYTLMKWDGRWRWLALAPLVVMIPVIAATAVMIAQNSNLAPIYMFFASPFATVYLVVLMIFRSLRNRAATVPTLGMAAPRKSSVP